MIVLQIIIIILAPYLLTKLSQVLRFQKFLSPVILSYAVGIAIANFSLFPLDESISHHFTEATVVLAIPLLLFSTNLIAWLQYARTTILSFFLCVMSSAISALCIGYLFRHSIEDVWIVSGMIAGVFSGGLPNMQAIGMALGAKQDLYVLLYAADTFCGGAYLLLLTSVMHPIVGLFLPDFKKEEHELEEIKEQASTKDFFLGILKGFGLAILILAISFGITKGITGKLNPDVLILLLTSFSIIASLSPTVRNIVGTFEAGEYLLLMFCVAVGMLSDFSVLREEGAEMIVFMGLILISIVLMHLFLCYLFKIDRDTALITAAASIYGPVFIGQVASAINNRPLIFSGMATGLVGIAVGNYIGIGIGYFLKYLAF